MPAIFAGRSSTSIESARPVFSVVVIERHVVRAGREATLGLAERLEGPEPVRPRGIVLTLAFLTDGCGSPIFNPYCRRSVVDAHRHRDCGALPAGHQSLFAHGPGGFAETLYAYVSQGNNNGSAFAGYSGFVQPIAGNVGSHGIAFADIAGGLVMTFGRFVPILFALALAGSLAEGRVTPAGLGTVRTDTPTFVLFIIGFVIIFALLNFLAALFIGPLDQALTNHLYS